MAESIRRSPFELVYGEQVRLPVDIIVGNQSRMPDAALELIFGFPMVFILCQSDIY